MELLPATKALVGENAVGLGTDYKIKKATLIGIGDYFKSKGGEIQLKTKAIKLFTDDAGKVIGIRVMKADKSFADIKTKAVILASGGFQNNPEMKVKYLGRYADQSVARCVPYNRGEAMLMAQEVGALASRALGSAYGHLQPYPSIVPQTDEEYESFDIPLLQGLMGAIQRFSVGCIAVNVGGRRFIDESVNKNDDLLNFEVCTQDEGRIFVIIDSELATPSLTQINLIKDNGGVVETADTIAELADKIGAHGYNGAQVKHTLEEFNDAIDKGDTTSLPVARLASLKKLAAPPFYAVQATAGISGPYGGIQIDARAQVLGRGNLPIAGLYAAPHAAGGIYSKHYGGSLGLCAVFGRISGLSAAQDIQNG